jgi:GNAT superfamily N-acetyltransferase
MRPKTPDDGDVPDQSFRTFPEWSDMTQIILCELSESDTEDYIALYKRCFGLDIPEAFLAAKSWGWGSSRSFLVYVARTADGRLVGAQSFFSRAFVGDTGRMVVAEAGDGMVDPAFQGKKIFARILQHSLNQLSTIGVPLIYTFPNKKAAPGLSSVGLSSLYNIRCCFTPLSVGSLVSRYVPVSAVGRKALDAPFVACRMALRPFRAPSILEWTLTDDVVSAVRQVKRPQRLGGRLERERTESYLRWRYGWGRQIGYSRFDYQAAIFARSGEVVGVVVMRPDRDRIEIHDFIIADAEQLKTISVALRWEVLPEMARGAERAERISPIYAYFWDISGIEEIVGALKLAGFWFRPTPHRLMMKAIDPQYADLVNPSRWSLFRSDIDQP